ncbi:hypothetical protein BDV96DRAFT_653750 [Lophiotrema nucula]|uniref:Uncharacterized protein n=1 Tax=Lophiotrema nucula TaxID=690887 RepID=A0A6A5YL07_9PLEO|nr:hypothetical protein BDV96DRAFT_653750 [Lophiotrema nucula]
MNILFVLLQALALAAYCLATTNLAANDFLPCGIAFPLTDENINYLRQIADLSVSPEQLGAATLFDYAHPSGPMPWAREDDNKVTIPYCYSAAQDRALITERFNTA